MKCFLLNLFTYNRFNIMLSIRKNQYLLPLPSSAIIKNWEGLSSGANDRILSIQVDSQNNVYAGGVFTAIGGISVKQNC